jgi:hypothetical protein
VALKLPKQTRDGATAEYWRLAPHAHFDILSKTLHCPLSLYISEAARRADKRPIPIPNLEGNVADVPSTELTGEDAVAAMASGDPRGAIYTKLKATTFFKDAQDVLED